MDRSEDKTGRIAVSVVYATPLTQRIIELEVPVGTTLRGAVERSRLLDEFPEIDLHAQGIGVFGLHRSADELVRAGDRVEIYRPLLVDPKTARRQREHAQRQG